MRRMRRVSPGMWRFEGEHFEEENGEGELI
jgi:hypothetical protein